LPNEEENPYVSQNGASDCACIRGRVCPHLFSLRPNKAPLPEWWWNASGASIPKAKVTALNQATGATATAETTDEGYYRLPYLLAGRYRVSIEKEGFTLNRVSDVPVQVGQNATVNVALKAGSVTTRSRCKRMPRWSSRSVRHSVMSPAAPRSWSCRPTGARIR